MQVPRTARAGAGAGAAAIAVAVAGVVTAVTVTAEETAGRFYVRSSSDSGGGGGDVGSMECPGHNQTNNKTGFK